MGELKKGFEFPEYPFEAKSLDLRDSDELCG